MSYMRISKSEVDGEREEYQDATHLQSSLDRSWVGITGVHESQYRPRRIDDLARLMLDVPLLHARRMMFTPAAVVSLFFQQKRARAPYLATRAVLQPSCLEGLHREKGRV